MVHSRPYPRLSWDVLFLVAKVSDPSMRPILGRVSFNLLVSTSTLLYREVEVRTTKELEKLFCERTARKKSSQPSRINPSLSLTQTTTLSLNFTSETYPPSSLDLSFDRIAAHDPLPLGLLHLQCRDRLLHIFQLVHHSLLLHLNPRRIEYVSKEQRIARTSTCWTRLQAAPLLSYWDRLETIDLKGIIPWRDEGKASLQLAAQPSPHIHRRRVLRLHLTTLLSPGHPAFRWILRAMEGHSKYFGLDAMQEGPIVLVVRSERERKEADAAIQSEVKGRWRSLFVVQLED